MIYVIHQRTTSVQKTLITAPSSGKEWDQMKQQILQQLHNTSRRLAKTPNEVSGFFMIQYVKCIGIKIKMSLSVTTCNSLKGNGINYLILFVYKLKWVSNLHNSKLKATLTVCHQTWPNVWWKSKMWILYDQLVMVISIKIQKSTRLAYHNIVYLSLYSMLLTNRQSVWPEYIHLQYKTMVNDGGT